jgi:hypothetical protein
MNAKFSAIKSHFLNWREWELNPIVIKELRQAVRSWTVIGMLVLFLIILFLTSLTFLVTQSFQVDANLQLGGAMFYAFMAILAGASIFFIPLYVGFRVAAERQENNPDLLYVSTLSPARIIFGKFLCGAYMTLLFFSACMPFMAFTNLLRGVDLPTVFFILIYIFLVVCGTNQLAIFFACIPASRPFKILMALGGIIASIYAVFALIQVSFGFMGSGIGSMMSGSRFWIGTLTFTGVGLAVTGLFFVLSVALISPPSANRALPVRIYITIIWLLGGLLSFEWVAQTGEADRMTAWTYPTFMLMMFALLVTISNSDQISQRVRRTIPQSRLKRALAFLFFNGAAGGLVWVTAIMAVTFSVNDVVGSLFSKVAAAATDSELWFATTTAYAFAYALSALFIQRKLLSRRPPKLTGLLAVLLAGAWAIVPSIIQFFLNQLSWKSVEGLQLGNIFNIAALRDASQRIYHLYFAFGWLLVMIVINAKWFVQQMENFHPPVRTTADISPPVMK